jgi:hypothetical protein
MSIEVTCLLFVASKEFATSLRFAFSSCVGNFSRALLYSLFIVSCFRDERAAYQRLYYAVGSSRIVVIVGTPYLVPVGYTYIRYSSSCTGIHTYVLAWHAHRYVPS